jgi:hypothetical protein
MFDALQLQSIAVDRKFALRMGSAVQSSGGWLRLGGSARAVTQPVRLLPLSGRVVTRYFSPSNVARDMS